MSAMLMGMMFAAGLLQAGPQAPLATVEALGKRVQIEVPARANYSMTARDRRLQGEVLVQATVGADGRAHDLRIARSSGSRHLDFAALQTVKRTRFVALDVEQGMAVNVPVQFNLPERRLVD